MAAKKAKPAPVNRGLLVAYPVLTKLSHDNEDYGPGDTVDLYADQAALLLPLGVIGPVEPTEGVS